MYFFAPTLQWATHSLQVKRAWAQMHIWCTSNSFYLYVYGFKMEEACSKSDYSSIEARIMPTLWNFAPKPLQPYSCSVTCGTNTSCLQYRKQELWILNIFSAYISIYIGEDSGLYITHESIPPRCTSNWKSQSSWSAVNTGNQWRWPMHTSLSSSSIHGTQHAWRPEKCSKIAAVLKLALHTHWHAVRDH